MTEEMNHDPEQPKGRLRYPAALELIILVSLGLVLMLGLSMIRSRVSERMERSVHAREEIASSWGRAQTIGGPLMIVPYRVRRTDNQGHIIQSIRRAYFLPDTLRVSGRVVPERRRRGIYTAVLYQSNLKLDGTFSRPDFSGWGIPPEDVLWDDATIVVGVPDLRGMRTTSKLVWDGGGVSLSGGSAEPLVWDRGLTARLPAGAVAAAQHTFSLDLNLNGSQSLGFIPVGQQTTVDLDSPWPDPGFAGSFLPESRTISASGFKARWNVSALARNYPQRWTAENLAQTADAIRSSEFRVDLVTPVSHYQQTMRATEYGALFIVLTFVTFFLYELFCPVSLHPVQYFLVGGALCVFYLLLLSISEHAPFIVAYLVASIATVGLICLYAIAIFRRALNVLGLFIVLTGLYAYLYVLLQLEDWALLAGSVGLFTILAFVMYLTRRVDWGSVHKTHTEAA